MHATLCLQQAPYANEAFYFAGWSTPYELSQTFIFPSALKPLSYLTNNAPDNGKYFYWSGQSVISSSSTSMGELFENDFTLSNTL